MDSAGAPSPTQPNSFSGVCGLLGVADRHAVDVVVEVELDTAGDIVVLVGISAGGNGRPRVVRERASTMSAATPASSISRACGREHMGRGLGMGDGEGGWRCGVI